MNTYGNTSAGARRHRFGVFVALVAVLASFVVSAPQAAWAVPACPTVVGGVVTPAPAPGVDWTGCDLSNADLSNADLRGASLQGATLTGSDLGQAWLKGVRSGGVIGVPSTLPSSWQVISGFLVGPGADLAGADLDGVDFSGAVLTGVRSGGVVGTPAALPADWQVISGFLIGPGVDLKGADLDGVDLSGADLTAVRSGNVTGVPTLPPGWLIAYGYLFGPTSDLSGAFLSGKDFSGIDLSGMNLSGIYLVGGTLGTALSGANLSKAGLVNLDLTDADLAGADLSDTYINGVMLRGAQLTDADFTGSKVWETDFADTNLSSATFTSATLNEVRSGGISGTPASLPPPWILSGGYLLGPKADLRNADLTGLNVSGVDLTGANLTGATGCLMVGTPANMPAEYGIGDGCLLLLPYAPYAPSVEGGLTSAIVYWGGQSSVSGRPVTGYSITVTPGGRVIKVAESVRQVRVTGLAPNTTHTFQVRALNAGGAGPASTTIARATTLKMKISRTSVTYGSSFNVSGFLRTTSGAPVEGHEVRIRVKAVGWPAYRTSFGGLLTDTKGSCWLPKAPGRSGYYALIAPGGVDVMGSSSGAVFVTVRPKVDVAVDDAWITRSQTAFFTGKVGPNAKGRKVYLQRYVGGRWSTVMASKLTESSRFTFRWRPSSGIDSSFRVYVPARTGYGSNVSRSIKLTVA